MKLITFTVSVEDFRDYNDDDKSIDQLLAGLRDCVEDAVIHISEEYAIDLKLEDE